MAFQLKDFTSIVASMINHARGTNKKITDWIPGSVARTLVEAPAVEIEELYLQFFTGLREAIPVATFQSFNFNKIPASFARGFASVSSEDPLPEAIVIATGTEFTTADGRVFLSTSNVIFPAGQTMITVPVQAEQPGYSYNVSAGAITDCILFGEGFSIGNQVINNGRDTETTEEQKSRFAEYVSSLSRGTVAACIYAAKQARITDSVGNITESVVRTGFIETPGYFKIFVYGSAGSPSAELIATGQRILDGSIDPVTQVITPGFRSAGVRTELLPMVERSISLSAQVAMVPGYVLNNEVIQFMRDQFATLLANTPPGEILYLADIETALLSAEGVRTVLIDGNSNIVCGMSEYLIVGTFSITSL